MNAHAAQSFETANYSSVGENHRERTLSSSIYETDPVSPDTAVSSEATAFQESFPSLKLKEKDTPNRRWWRFWARPSAAGEDPEAGDPKKAAKASGPESAYTTGVTARRIFALAWSSSATMIVIGFIASILEGATLPAFAIVFGRMFQVFTKSKSQIEGETWKYSVGFVGIGVFEFIVAGSRTALFGIASERLARDLRVAAFSNLVEQDVTYFDRRKAGELGGKLNNDVQVIQYSFSKLGAVLFNLAQCVVGIIVAFIFAPALTGVLIALSPLVVLAGAAQMIEMSGNTKRSSEAYASAGSVAAEVFSNIRTTKAFEAERYETQRYGSKLDPLYRLGRRRYISDGLFFGLSMLVIFCVYALALWWGGQLIARGSLNLGNLLTAFFSAILGFMGVGQAAQVWPDVTRGLGAGGELFAMIDRVPQYRRPDPGAEVVTQPLVLKQGIVFENVHFRYPTRMNVEVLRGISLTIPNGKTVAIVGGSGAGKSTIIQLLMRFYDIEPQGGGLLLFDGTPAWNYDFHALRSQIGLVSQEPVLFSGTIRDNILYGKRDATDEEVIQALREANAYSFVMALPDGLDTEVGERGLALSGGQKQRIAIARAILKHPTLLCLDESTSALDAESEALVQEALDRMMASDGVTSVVIAHRLSTVARADLILVMQDGVVVEQGNHSELMALGPSGFYYQLVEKQLASGDMSAA
ncbi:ATP-binding cassette, sub-family B, member 1 [Cyanidioschyzon merolae strain 10D]|uniref:Probable ATP-dependent transporter ycf16 n=1 Tax=Cyanidioschyzon merolae (strain NIES-3377 / 10D) TaxID=280699 RepID=M1VAN7_CYAM1|nr:ATP-binding cassette, sub-family B, member 1 [Cyanidioschyzon merolae strain 10D]BAM79212.1 ATP-binding cassette, sub-family B, member 1 [Cyanidioschyzon merolae strain 10D]|eukprot:XP_005535498.1 ATP-binding cassette, sub-family B, member 1 [Cyanidioschyzon merolae strain 10D]